MIISIALQALTGTFDTDIARSSKATQKQMKEMEAKITHFALAATAAFTAAATGLGVLVKSSINSADAISKASQKVGLTTEQLSGLKYAASLADVEFEQFTSGLEKFNKATIDAVNGSTQQIAAFRAVGISVKDLKTSSPEQLLLKISDAFSKSKDSAAKTAIAIALFGKAGADLIPLLNSGSKGINELTAEADKFGLVISGATAKSAEEFNDNLTRLHAQVQGLGLEIAANALPQLIEFEKKLQDPAVRDGLSKLAQGIITVTTALVDAAAGFAGFAKWLGESFAASQVGANDLVRINDQLGELNKQLDEAKKHAADGSGIPGIDSRGDIPKLEKQIALLNARKRILEESSKPAPSAEHAAAVQSGTSKDLTAPVLPVDMSTLYAAQLKARLALLTEGLKQQQSVNQDYYNNGLISTDAYYAQKLAAIKAGEGNEIKAIQESIAQIKKEQAAGELTPQQRVALQAKLVGLYGQMSLAEKQAADEAINLGMAQKNQADAQKQALEAIAIASDDSTARSRIQREADDLADAHAKMAITNQKYYDGLARIENEDYERKVDLAKKEFDNFKGDADAQIRAEAEKNAKIQSLTQEHENTVSRIKKEAELSRVQILQYGLQASGNVFGALADLQDKSTRDGFERYKKFAIAQATISAIESAVEAARSLYSIPYVGPVLAVAAGAAALAAGYAQVSQIRNQQFTGRAIGGPVNAGGMYQVNENGPELLQYGNKTLLMMGDKSGTVTPAMTGRAANDSRSTTNVTVEVHGSNGPATATTSQTDQGTLIRLAVNGAQAALQKDISKRGPTSKLLQQTFALQRAGQ